MFVWKKQELLFVSLEAAGTLFVCLIYVYLVYMNHCLTQSKLKPSSLDTWSIEENYFAQLVWPKFLSQFKSDLQGNLLKNRGVRVVVRKVDGHQGLPLFRVGIDLA